MKRSEIVDEITHILDMEAEDLCYPFLAELILTILENKGMLPPALIFKEYAGHGDYKEIVFHEWESEDA